MNVIELLNKHNLKIAELNLFLQDRTVNGWGENVVDVVMSHIQTLEQENKQLREALSYYADEKHYEPYGAFDTGSCDITEDGGYIARQALAGETDEK